MLETSEIRDTIRQHHFNGVGSIKEHDVRFLCDLVDKYRPANVFELGVASGILSTFLLRSLERVSNRCMLYSVDNGEDYCVDLTKKVGFLIAENLPNPGCKFELHRGCWVGEAERILGGHKLDLIWINADHVHPWPTIDTMMLLPLTNPNAVVAYRDIMLQTKPGACGKGPFNVFDEFPQPKFVSDCEHTGSGAFQLTKPVAEYETILLSALEKSWTADGPMPSSVITRISEFVARHYSASFAQAVIENIANNHKVLNELSQQKKSA